MRKDFKKFTQISVNFLQKNALKSIKNSQNFGAKNESKKP